MAFAEKVVVSDVVGRWEQLTPPGRAISLLQRLEVGEGFIFVPTSSGFAPGRLVLADSDGNPYYAQPCTLPGVCGGFFEVPAPQHRDFSGPLKRVFAAIVDLIAKDNTNFINAVGNASAPQGAGLVDDVVELSQEGLDLCHSFSTMTWDKYNLRILAKVNGKEPVGKLDWQGQCPARVMFVGLKPGVFKVDAHGQNDHDGWGYILVSPSPEFGQTAKEFDNIKVATRPWIDKEKNGQLAVGASARRAFLVGYLHLLAQNSGRASTVDAAGGKPAQ
jgi:hypothetical protein